MSVHSLPSSYNPCLTNSPAVPAGTIQHLDDSNFKNSIASGTVVVDFYAEHCPPCKQFAPIFENVAGELNNDAKFGKFKGTGEEKTLKDYNLQSAPTIIIFKDGKEVERREGLLNAYEFRNWVESAL